MSQSDGSAETGSQSTSIWFKFKLIILLVWLLSWLGLYFWFQSLQTKQQQISQQEQLLTRLSDQLQQCDQLLSNQQGEFGEYEYCRRLKERLQP